MAKPSQGQKLYREFPLSNRLLKAYNSNKTQILRLAKQEVIEAAGNQLRQERSRMAESTRKQMAGRAQRFPLAMSRLGRSSAPSGTMRRIPPTPSCCTRSRRA